MHGGIDRAMELAGFQNFDRSSRFGAEREFCGEIFDLFWEKTE